jgi:hypothetical protein
MVKAFEPVTAANDNRSKEGLWWNGLPISPDTPLRLKVAAELAFPDGSMTVSGLRNEGKRGRLSIERIAGKDYTTLASIKQMRESCRVEVKARTFGIVQSAEKAESSLRRGPGLSSTAAGITPQAALLSRIKERKSA